MIPVDQSRHLHSINNNHSSVVQSEDRKSNYNRMTGRMGVKALFFWASYSLNNINSDLNYITFTFPLSNR